MKDTNENRISKEIESLDISKEQGCYFWIRLFYKHQAPMEQFSCVGLGSICYISCLDSCLQTYVLRKIKTARFMLCLL